MNTVLVFCISGDMPVVTNSISQNTSYKKLYCNINDGFRLGVDYCIATVECLLDGAV